MSWTDPYYTDQLLSIKAASGGNPAGIVRELVLAYNERCEACGMDNDTGDNTDLTLAVPSEGDTALHYQGLFKQLQDGMDDLIGSGRWIDYDYDGGEDEPDVVTNSAWRTKAGLPSGVGNYRRVTGFTNDNFTQPIFGTAGAIAEDDFFGPWIIEDVQDGLDALRFTREDSMKYVEVYSKPDDPFSTTSPASSTASAAKTWSCNAWTNSDVIARADVTGNAWSAGALRPLLRGNIYKDFFEDPDDWGAHAGSTYFKIELKVYTNSLSCKIDVWGKADVHPDNVDHVLHTGNSGYGNETFAKVLTTSAASNEYHTTNTINGSSVCPLDQMGLTGGEGYHVMRKIYSLGVIKWDFTNRSYTI